MWEVCVVEEKAPMVRIGLPSIGRGAPDQIGEDRLTVVENLSTPLTLSVCHRHILLHAGNLQETLDRVYI